jgi:hypothetical protein
VNRPDPGPWIDPDVRDVAPWESNEGIVKFFEFPVPIPGMSPRAFHIYWQKHHSPHVMNVTVFSQFMRKYNSGHRFPSPVPGIPERYRQAGPWEGAAEVWVNSVEKIGEWLGQAAYADLIQPDEPRFISQDGQTQIVLTREEVVFESDPDMAENLLTKVYLLLRRAPGLGRDAFHRAASDHAKAVAAEGTLRRHLRKFVVSHKLRDPLPLEGLQVADIDAVFELWFADINAAQAFFAEPDYDHRIRPTEEAVFDLGSMRCLVARMRVVHDEMSFQPSTMQPLPFSWS